ncbi:MAG: PmoA family protein [Acidobacteriaceae bacterium]|nr:PmoA family protein [Acidobacteriaceae bacterium]
MRIFVPAACAALLVTAQGSAQVDLEQAGTDHVSIAINGQPFSVFHMAGAKPFLAPLKTASGVIVTRRFPMEMVEGESRDHPHHCGLWIGYGDVNHLNFWENAPESKVSPGNPTDKGTLVLRKVDSVSPGKKSGTISATFAWRAPNGEDVLEEKRTITFYADPDVRIVDVDSTFTADVPAKFGDTKEGFFAIRLADSMIEKNGGLMTNSEGAQTEKHVWGKRAEWVDYDGMVEGRKVGIVIFDNPANYNHPPRWHARAYGLFAVNPFGVKDFDPQATETGGHELARGETMRLRYRVIVHAGDVTKKKIGEWYSDYTKKTR